MKQNAQGQNPQIIDAEAIFMAAIAGADAGMAVDKCLSKFGKKDLKGDIILAAAGKLAVPMAEAAYARLGKRISKGVVISPFKTKHASIGKDIRILPASHPIPDETSVSSTRELVSLVRTAESESLVLTLLSGGGSACLCLPADGIALSDKQKTTRLLLGSGASITEMNAVRKHLSAVKGGRLAAMAGKARMLTLVVSDVVGNDLHSIASGPTVPDPTTFENCLDILAKYDLNGNVPTRVLKRFKDGAAVAIPETPKPTRSAIFSNKKTFIVADNSLALTAAREKAVSLGYKTHVVSDDMTGPVEDAARFYLRNVVRAVRLGEKTCMLFGGETTVSLPKRRGKGGRNQHLSLLMAEMLKGVPGVCMLCAGTDGIDGGTDAAGAAITGETAGEAENLGLKIKHYMDRHDSNAFFRKAGGLVVTGPTRTNVMDLVVIISNPT